jgi:hypothetical protein
VRAGMESPLPILPAWISLIGPQVDEVIDRQLRGYDLRPERPSIRSLIDRIHTSGGELGLQRADVAGGRLTPIRIFAARSNHEILAAGEPYERHAFVCERLACALDDERPIGAVTRAMRALAAPLPTEPPGVLSCAQAWSPPRRPWPDAAASVAACRHEAASPPRAQLQVLATVSAQTLRSMALGRPDRRKRWPDRSRAGRPGDVGPAQSPGSRGIW